MQTTITIDNQTFTITAEEFDNGWAPTATDEQGNNVYLGGEDDEDDATPEEALARGEYYLHEQHEHGNLQTRLDTVEHLVRMMRESGQDDLIAEAATDGDTVESIAHNLVTISGWDTDETTLVEAIERVLADR